jgi:hypothetical protein
MSSSKGLHYFISAIDLSVLSSCTDFLKCTTYHDGSGDLFDLDQELHQPLGQRA